MGLTEREGVGADVVGLGGVAAYTAAGFGLSQSNGGVCLERVSKGNDRTVNFL